MDNKPNNDNRNRKNLNSLLTLVGWALLLTVLLQYLYTALGNSGESATTHEIMYSQFEQLVEEGHVDQVILQDGQSYSEQES